MLKPLHIVSKSVSPTLIADDLNIPVLLNGIGMWVAVEDITWGECFRGGKGNYSSTYVTEFFLWVHSQGFNLVYFQMNAYWCLNDSGYRNKIADILNIANQNGVYVVMQFDSVSANNDHVGIPYDPYLSGHGISSTAQFNSACTALANICKNYPNAIIEIYNEPAMGNSAGYTAYWVGIESSLQAIRTAGFTGIISVMGAVSLTNAVDYGAGNSSMAYAIEHLSLFKNYGSVMTDNHMYYCYLHDYGGFPNPLSALDTYVMSGCRVAEAQNAGIPVCIFENGVLLSWGRLDEQLLGVENLLDVCNTHGICWSTWEATVGFPFAIITSLNPPTFNTQGLGIKSKVEVIQTVNAKFVGAVSDQVAAGETVTVTVTKPDTTTETLTAQTLVDKTYSVSKVYTVAGSYSAKAHGDADASFSAWDSAVAPFTVTLTARTGTLVVTLT